MEDEYHGETEELSETESESEGSEDTITLQTPRSPSKRRGERKSSLLPQKKTKVTFAEVQYREQISFKKELYYLKIIILMTILS